MTEKAQSRHFLSSRSVPLTIALSFQALSCQAMEWRPDAAFGAEVEYTDNLFMVEESPTSDTFLVGTVDVRLSGQSETRSVRLDGSARVQRLQRTKSANNEFYSAGLDYYEVFVHGNFGLRADYSEDSTRTTDLETIGIRPYFIFGKRRASTIQPRIEFDTNENNRLAFNGVYELVRYDLENFTDYTNYQLGFDWFHSVNDAVELDTQIIAQRYDSLDNLVDYDYGSLLEIADISASARWHYQIGAGLGYLIRKFDENYWTFLGRLRATYDSDYSQYYFSTESSLQPTASANLSRLSQVSLGYRHALTETSRISAEVRASRSILIDTTPSYNNDLLGFDLDYSANINERLSWAIRYSFIGNRTSLDNRNRISNSVFLTLTLGFTE